MTGRRKGHFLARLAVTVVLVGGACVAWTSASPGASGIDFPIVFTQLPIRPELERQPGAGAGTLRRDYGEGGRIVRLDPDGTLRVLTEGFDSACGGDVAFDGERILFAGKRRADDPWNIWEMGADGSNPRQITRDMGNCRSPAYQATLYTIVSTEPWYQIMFVSDRAGEMNEYGSGPAQSLYSCKLDGGAVRRLTMNLSDDFDPFLMRGGRVLLASWQRRDLRRGLLGRVAIFGVNTDGADYALYCGDQGRRVKHMPCETTDGLVVFVETDSVGFDGAGQLAAVRVRRPLYSYQSLTQDESVLYHSPSPLRDGAVLVSIKPAGQPVPQADVSIRPAGEPVPQADENRTHGVYRLDPRTGEKSLVFDDPAFHDVHARLLAPRPQPDGRSSVVNEEYPTGKLYCLNVYLTDPDIVEHMLPGTVRSLRVIEGVPMSADDPRAHSDDSSTRGFGGPVSANGMAPIVRKRLLGQVPVEEDGSFHIEIPADVPVELQTLDAHGMALRSCGWIWAKHREPRGCIGCHEDPELTPENRFVLALQRPGMQLMLPPDKRRTVDFRHDVMPIITGKCVSCHNGDSGGLNLRAERYGYFNRAYESLFAGSERPAPDDRPAAGKYVHPGQARTSPLIWRLFGRNTSRPWDATYKPGPTFPTHPPAEAAQLTEDERLTIIEWIDLGAHWDGINK